MSEEPIATVGDVPVYQSKLDRLLRASGFEEVVTVHGPARVGKTAELVHQLQMASVYDHAYWEARLHSVVLSAMMHAYIDTGSATFTPPEPAYGVPPIDRHRMMVHTLAEGGFLVSSMDVAADRIDIKLPPTGEMAAPYFNDPDGYIRRYRGQPGETLTVTMLVDAMEKPTVERAQPDYLRHDPTKQVGKRRQRKAYGRKGDRR